MSSGETHLLDNTLAGADRVTIVELMLRKVEFGYGGPVLDLVDGSLKLGLADSHLKLNVQELREMIWERDRITAEGCARASDSVA